MVHPIDAHQHFWRFNPVRDSWISEEMMVLRRDFLPDDSAPYAAGGVVAVQADQSADETRFLLELAEKYPCIVGVVGWVDLLAPDLADQLAHWRRAPALKGFRHIAQAEPDDFLARPEIVRAINTLGEHDYTFDILIYPQQLTAAEQLVARAPGVRFVLDHCAKPPIASGDLTAWRAGINRLARHPNIWCKVSGLVTEAAWYHWTDDDVFPVLDAVLEAFGPQRLLFGSDFPVCLLASTYRDMIHSLSRWAERLTVPERALLFGGTARAVYHLEG